MDSHATLSQEKSVTLVTCLWHKPERSANFSIGCITQMNLQQTGVNKRTVGLDVVRVVVHITPAQN